ncbi:MAG: hypothetical protein J6A21_06020 [Lentisphaeria bacterium]|nr:hypothetical protein [Lentisphaeria bacterium]
MTKKTKRPEVTWSLMHPTSPDPEYMKKVVREADKCPYKVDSFEVCALCHELRGGLNGLAHFRKYGKLSIDHKKIDENISLIRKIVKIAHDSGRPLYYWHREVTVPAGIVEKVPELLDEKGEFDLLGEAFTDLLRCKIGEAFESVPELDGIVLTLTEADYSAIHNSTPDLYPPEKVVEHVTKVFYEELAKRGKRLILRSFGSIAKDYEDILAGAKMASDAKMRFEVETKITPYDFDPFLPENPFLRHTGKLALGAECDCLGEFLGAGNLPAENVENILRWVRAAQAAKVDRYAIRLDRVGNNVFDCYPVNIYAYMRAINDEKVSAEEIYRDFASARYPESCREELVLLGRQGLEAILKMNYIRGNVIFHQTPPHASFKYFKAGGFFSNFKEKVPLKYNSGIWGVLSGNRTGTRKELLAEKEEALALAKDGFARVKKLKKLLPAEEFARLSRLWSNLVCAAGCISAYCKCTAAYFDSMEETDSDATKLKKAVAEAETFFASFDVKKSGKEAFFNGLDRGLFDVRKNILQVYAAPLRALCGMLQEEYDAEFAARHLAEMKKAEDLIVPGGITDEWRCERFMHACHAVLENGVISRIVGNQVFPNGTLEVVMHGKEKAPHVLKIRGKGELSVTVNGKKTAFLSLDGKKTKRLPLPAGRNYTFTFARGKSREYPLLSLLALFSR